jgi:hypothetical protein
MTVKEIKTALMTPGTTFFAPTRLGEKQFVCNDSIGFDEDRKMFNKGVVESISIDRTLYLDSMNVKSFGPTCVHLYTFDMMGNRTKGKIKYKDVEIVKVGKE